MYFHQEQQRYETEQRLARAQVENLRRAARAQKRLVRAERRVREAREAARTVQVSLRVTA
jgi:hypothetical protein